MPHLPLNACPVKEGAYQVPLEKGKYHRYLSDGKFVLPLEDVEVSGAEGQELPKITVTKEMWEARKKPDKDWLTSF